MRILNRKEFMEIEGQVLFAKYKPSYFEELEIKVANCENDFTVDTLVWVYESFERIDAAEKDSSIDLELDAHFTGRDGCYEEDQLFAVFTPDDVELIIGRLEEVLVKMKGN